MLDWIVEALWSAVTSVPAWIVAEDSPNFMLVRAMFGLLLIETSSLETATVDDHDPGRTS